MNSFSAGQFTCSVSGPYPCWIDILDEQGRSLRLHHAEVSDLLYALTRAKNEAKWLLGPSASEID